MQLAHYFKYNYKSHQSKFNLKTLFDSDVPAAEYLEILESENLAGYGWYTWNERLPEKFHKKWKAEALFQDLIFKVKNKELILMEQQAQAFGLVAVRIKGMALIHQIYPHPGSRNLSDIDLLIWDEQLESWEELLQKKAFFRCPEKMWLGNDFKIVCRKDDLNFPQLFIDIELHTKLFWSENVTVERKVFKENGFFTLATTDHYFFLVVHWIHQHTFVGLKYLVDIYLYWKKFGDQIDKERLKDLIINHGMTNTFWALQIIFSEFLEIDLGQNLRKTWQSKIITILLTPKFILKPNRKSSRYLILKHLLKQDLATALKYDFAWLKGINPFPK